MNNQELEQLSINTIRTLSIDTVQQAKSGHHNRGQYQHRVYRGCCGTILGLWMERIAGRRCQ